MPKITAKLVKELRDKSGAGMMDAKKALSAVGGEMDAALGYLRKTGFLKAQKKSERATGQGLIHSYIHGGGRIGVLIEVGSETDFVARNEVFANMVHDIALHIAAQNPLYVSREEVPESIVKKEREIYQEQAKAEGKSGDVVKKIVEGKLEKYYAQVCLLEQPFVKDEDVRVREVIDAAISKLGENIRVKRFARFELGE